MVHQRYEKKCGAWSHKWAETKRERKGKHGNPCTDAIRYKVYESCGKCGSARTRTETTKAPGHRMQPINDVIMKGDDGMMVKIRVLQCGNGCGHKDTKQVGKKWKP